MTASAMLKFQTERTTKHFADEAAQAGEAEAGEEDADGDAAIDGHFGEQAAELVEVAVMDAVVDDADEEEHAGRADAVGDHLEHRAVHAHLPVVGIVLRAGDGAPNAEAEDDVAHVADGAVGDHTLEVGLGQGGECTPDHAEDADAADPVREVIAGGGADGIADAE